MVYIIHYIFICIIIYIINYILNAKYVVYESIAKELNEARNKQLKQVEIENKMKNLKKKVEESEQLMHYMHLNSIVIKEA